MSSRRMSWLGGVSAAALLSLAPAAAVADAVPQDTLERIQRECLRAYPPELLAEMASGNREVPADVDADPKAQMQFLDKEIPLDKGLFYPILLEDLLPAFERYVSPGTRFLDLGSGDGRVVLLANVLGAHAVGIEYDRQMVEISRRAAEALAALLDRDRLEILQGDFFDSSWSGYDVIFFFDQSSFEPERVREKLEREMDPGARLVVGYEQAPFPGLELLERDRKTQPTLTVYRQGAAASTADDELRKHWKIEKLGWQGPLDESSGIEIKNELGDVRVRLSSDEEVYVSAVVQRHEHDPHEADVRIGERDGRMTIETAFVTRQSFEPGTITEGMERRRIDLTVIVPLGARLGIRTVKGLIEAKGLESDVSATSTSGDIVVSVAGSIQARTERGEITATFRSAEWNGTPRLETVTGDVNVWLPSDADATVRAETSGLITTDYSLSIDSQPPPSERKSATARIGGGRRPLSIKSTRGSVRILRSRG